jgi:hypothetical protein
LKKEKETREKYKALTGKEAPRELTYMSAEIQAAITGGDNQAAEPTQTITTTS